MPQDRAVPASERYIHPIVKASGLPEALECAVGLAEQDGIRVQSVGQQIIGREATAPDIAAEIVNVTDLEIGNRRQNARKHTA